MSRGRMRRVAAGNGSDAWRRRRNLSKPQLVNAATGQSRNRSKPQLVKVANGQSRKWSKPQMVKATTGQSRGQGGGRVETRRAALLAWPAALVW